VATSNHAHVFSCVVDIVCHFHLKSLDIFKGFLSCLVALSGCKVTMKMENGGHFGRHLEFRRELQGDSWGLLVCCSTHISGPILKNSACYELFLGLIYLMLLAYFSNFSTRLRLSIVSIPQKENNLSANACDALCRSTNHILSYRRQN